MGIFERRHYQAIAEVVCEELKELKRANYRAVTSYVCELEDFAEHLAQMFSRDNPNFKRERFLKACGMEEK